MSFFVGIDLGTTHTAVAYRNKQGDEQVLRIRQRLTASELSHHELLPSFLYYPTEAERLGEQQAGSWWIGHHARQRGAEVPRRLIASAKSWLSYRAVDRSASILPWRLHGDEEGAEDVPRMSPVEASSRILKRVADCFEQETGCSLTEQQVVVTVPASFDAVARELTVRAARDAGLEVRLLEEPQAAFYAAWNDGERAHWFNDFLRDERATVLVVDVGGGTTDLSLIRVVRTAGDFDVQRIAVGEHLLLGGDNVDLGLAHLCEQRLVEPGERLKPRRFAQLTALARCAKEKLLGKDAPAEVAVALGGGGSRLVGSTLRTQLGRDEVQRTVLDGFFPRVGREEPAPRAMRSAVVAFGLRYERDAAITRHVATFLRQAGEQPTALLMNGGMFHSPLVRQRLQEVLASWSVDEPKPLLSQRPQVAVARGAALYAAMRERGEMRIASTQARSVYVELAGADNSLLCVLPRGAPEGKVYQAAEHPLKLQTGKLARFELYAGHEQDVAGQLVPREQSHKSIARLVTEVPKAPDALEATFVGVHLEAELSAIGTVELCGVGSDGKRFPLSFDVSTTASATTASAKGGATSQPSKEDGRLEEALQAIQQVYGRSAAAVPSRQVKGLGRELERLLGKRSRWDGERNRRLADRLLLHRKRRRRSPEHERVFWQLVGYCMRPGWGHARDPERMHELWSLFEQRLAHAKEARGWQHFWIAWRRVAAGLDEAAQTRLRDVVDPLIAPSEEGLKALKAFRNDARFEMLDLGASLERVAATRRGQLGGWIVELTWTERDARLWAALGKAGARVPVHASAHRVVAARTVERWLDHLLRERWEGIVTAPRAAVAMCRLTGDRARDVSESVRREVGKRLVRLGVDEELRRPIFEVVEQSSRQRNAFYGEDLPVGLRLADP
jgi:molecular chaperone DnaK (HSP70)